MQCTELQSRAKFIAGLAPVTTQLPEGTECSICISSPTEPVQLPCDGKHKFCRECIHDYLTNSSKNNSCPNCRQKLFISPFEERTLIHSARHTLVSRAVRAAGLAFDQPRLDFEPIGRRFGFKNMDVSDMARAIPNAQNYLIMSATPNFATAIGPATLRVVELKSRIVAMSLILPHLASLSGRPYSEQQMADWTALVACLRPVIGNLDGESTDALILPRQLRAALAVEAKEKNVPVAATGFFESIEYRALNDDLDTLLSYVAQSAGDQWHEDRQDERDAERRRAQVARMQALAAPQEPRPTTRVNRILRRDGVCTVM